MSRITEVLLLEGGEQIHCTLYVSVVHVVCDNAVYVGYNRSTGGYNELVLRVVTVDGVLVVAGLLELSCHLEECVPCPLVVLEQGSRILETSALNYALSIVEQGVEGNLIDSAVVSAVEAELVEYVAGAVPLGAFQVQNGVNGLVSALDNAVGEVAYLEREQVGGVAGLDSCSQLVVAFAVGYVDVLEDPALAGGVVAGSRNAVDALEHFGCRGGLVDIPPRHPLDALVDLQVGVVEACGSLLSGVDNGGVCVVGGGYERGGDNGVCVGVGSRVACSGAAYCSSGLLVAGGQRQDHTCCEDAGCGFLKVYHSVPPYMPEESGLPE